MESNDAPCDVGKGLQPHLILPISKLERKCNSGGGLQSTPVTLVGCERGEDQGGAELGQKCEGLSISTLAARVTAGACSVRLTRWNALFRPFYTDVAGEDACLQPGEQF